MTLFPEMFRVIGVEVPLCRTLFCERRAFSPLENGAIDKNVEPLRQADANYRVGKAFVSSVSTE